MIKESMDGMAAWKRRYEAEQAAKNAGTQTAEYVQIRQYGSNGFHITMSVITAGLWLPVWWMLRRKTRTRTTVRTFR